MLGYLYRHIEYLETTRGNIRGIESIWYTQWMKQLEAKGYRVTKVGCKSKMEIMRYYLRRIE
jgi:hypothetical protein